MIKITCDRCDKEIQGCYYTIDINSHNDTRVKAPMLSDNYYSEANTNVAYKRYITERMYCEKCVKEIKIFIGED